MASSTTSGAPLKTALIGLSASPTGFGWLNHFHLPSILKHSSHFHPVAVLSSSQTNAEKAIEKHNLPGVRAYGSPEALAQDANGVELLVVGVKAPLHAQVLMPSLRKTGKLKALFVEWPIGRSLAETLEIADLARVQNLRTAVGLQGRYGAVVRRIQQLARTHVGKILSTNVVGTLPTGDGVSEKAGSKYSLDPANGATMVDIHLAHFVECLTTALDADVLTVSGVVKTMHPTTNIVDDVTGEVVEKDCPKPSPDQVLVQGTLKPKAPTSTTDGENEIVYSIHMRSGSSLSGGMTWSIHGTEGEIEITGPFRMVPWIALPAPWKIRFQQSKDTAVEEEQVSESEPGQPAVGRLWDAFVEGNQGEWPDFEHAVKIHRVVDGVWRSSREGIVVRL